MAGIKTKITQKQVIEPLNEMTAKLTAMYKDALATLEERKDDLDDIAIDWINGIKMNIDILENTLDTPL